LPTELPKCLSSFVPYIYSHDEIRRLLNAVPSYQRVPGRLEPPTLRAILLLLYGAGLRRGEALGLSVADVDLASSLLAVRDIPSPFWNCLTSTVNALLASSTLSIGSA
jgi:integrase/recombinase XerD